MPFSVVTQYANSLHLIEFIPSVTHAEGSSDNYAILITMPHDTVLGTSDANT